MRPQMYSTEWITDLHQTPTLSGRRVNFAMRLVLGQDKDNVRDTVLLLLRGT